MSPHPYIETARVTLDRLGASELDHIGGRSPAEDNASLIEAAGSPMVSAISKGPYVVYTNGVHVIAHDRVTRSHWAVIVGDRRVLVARGMRDVDDRSYVGHASCRSCGRTRPADDLAHDEKLQGPLGLGEVVR
ncbi:MAG: hypothetical protein ACKV2T_43115 [Kofleriaceae bacterium]